MLCCRSCTATCTCSRFMLFSLAGLPAAAVLGKKADELVHGLVVGAVDDEAPVLAAAHETRPDEVREVERQRGRGKAQLLGDAARGEALGAGLHQQTKGGKARFLGEPGERFYGLRRFHVSRIIEMKNESQ